MNTQEGVEPLLHDAFHPIEYVIGISYITNLHCKDNTHFL